MMEKLKMFDPFLPTPPMSCAEFMFRRFHGDGCACIPTVDHDAYRVFVALDGMFKPSGRQREVYAAWDAAIYEFYPDRKEEYYQFHRGIRDIKDFVFDEL